MKHSFDTLVSLGWNCEVSFRIQDYLNRNIDSYLYSWVRVQNGEGLLRSLYHPEDVLAGNITLLDCGMLRCEKCQLDFHGIGEKGKLFLENGAPNEEVVSETIKELRSRIGHTSDKFQKLLKSDKRSLFIWKLNENYIVDQQVLENIKKVFCFLSEKYVSGKFVLMIVIEKKRCTEELLSLQNERLVVKNVQRVADKDNVMLDGDIDGWMEILAREDLICGSAFQFIYLLYLKIRWRMKRHFCNIYLKIENVLVYIYHRIRGIE